eukprot:scaffold53_cov193-Pinguiococcus_pyrenoidosus.AAC.61
MTIEPDKEAPGPPLRKVEARAKAGLGRRGALPPKALALPNRSQSCGSTSTETDDSAEIETQLRLERAEQLKLMRRLHEVTRAAVQLSAFLPNATDGVHPVRRKLPPGVYNADMLGVEVSRIHEEERVQICHGPTVLLGVWDSRYQSIITYGSGALVDVERRSGDAAAAVARDKLESLREEQETQRSRALLDFEADATSLLVSGSSPLILTAAHVVHPQVPGISEVRTGGLRRRYSRPQRFEQRILVGLPVSDRETAWRFEARVVDLEGTGFCHKRERQFLDILILEVIGQLPQTADQERSDGGSPRGGRRALSPVRDEELKWDPSKSWVPPPAREIPADLEQKLHRLTLHSATTPGQPVDVFGFGQTDLNPGGPLNGLTCARGVVKDGTVLDYVASDQIDPTIGDKVIYVYEGRIPQTLRTASDAARAQYGWVPLEFEEPVAYRDLSSDHHLNVTIADHGQGMSGGPVCNHKNELVAVLSRHTTFFQNKKRERQHVTEGHGVRVSAISEALEKLCRIRKGLREGTILSSAQGILSTRHRDLQMLQPPLHPSERSVSSPVLRHSGPLLSIRSQSAAQPSDDVPPNAILFD